MGATQLAAFCPYQGEAVMNRYFVYNRARASAVFFDGEEEMLEYVRHQYNLYGEVPTIYYGKEVEFEPTTVVKGWKVVTK